MKVAVLGACGPAGVNVCKALAAAGHEVVGFDGNAHHLPFGEPYGTMHRLTGDPSVQLAAEYPAAVMAQPAALLSWLIDRQAWWPASVPSRDTYSMCVNKPEALARWHRAGLRTFAPIDLEEPYPDWLHIAKATFDLPFWLRARSGSGARGAVLVESLAQAFHWLRFWAEGGVGWQWIAEEYLPGRDYCWSSLWQDGRLIGSFSRERHEWIFPQLSPSGRTGTPTVCTTVHDARVNEAARLALLMIDEKPNGVYCVDLREDAAGVVRPTEINAGRWATTSPLYMELGPNLVDLHAQACAGVELEQLGEDIYPAGVTLHRHIDCGSTLVRAA